MSESVKASKQLYGPGSSDGIMDEVASQQWQVTASIVFWKKCVRLILLTSLTLTMILLYTNNNMQITNIYTQGLKITNSNSI